MVFLFLILAIKHVILENEFINGAIVNTIEKDAVATISFSLHTSDGTLLEKDDNLTYLHGHEKILRGMEKALQGKAIGDIFSAEIDPQDAFGTYQEQEPIRIHKRELGKIFDRLQVNSSFPIQNSRGEQVLVYVQKKSGNYISITPNHPLAGITLLFEAKVMDIREASTEELNKNTGSCSCC